MAVLSKIVHAHAPRIKEKRGTKYAISTVRDLGKRAAFWCRASFSLVGDVTFLQGSTTNMENSVKAFKKFHSETGKAISDSDSQIVCDFIMLTANFDNVQDVVRTSRSFCLVDLYSEIVAWIRTD